jgi:hypothetical protein
LAWAGLWLRAIDDLQVFDAESFLDDNDFHLDGRSLAMSPSAGKGKTAEMRRLQTARVAEYPMAQVFWVRLISDRDKPFDFILW